MPSSITCTNLSDDQIDNPVNITTNTLLNDRTVPIAPVHMFPGTAIASHVVTSTKITLSHSEHQM